MKYGVISLLLVGVLLISGFNGCELETGDEYTPIKTIAQNPEEWRGIEVKIKGKRINIGAPIILEDNEGYEIRLNKNCEEENRNYHYGETYSFKGTVQSVDPPIFECTGPVS